jgi:branched-chain amino acid transport system permease protein
LDSILQAVANGLTLGGIYAITATGFAVIFSTTRTFHFAHGGVYLWVAYVISALIQDSVNIWVAIAAGAVVSVVLGTTIEVGIYRRMRQSGASRLRIFVASLGLLIILQNTVDIVFGFNVQPIALPGLVASVHVGSVFLQSSAVLQFAAAVVTLLVVMGMFRWTQIGRSMRAVASNVEMAALVGIEPRRTYLWAFVVGSILLVPAAFLNSVTTGLDSGIGGTIMLITLISVIVGGVGSIPGAALGGWMIGLSQTLSTLVWPTQWQNAVAFGVLLLFILFRPTGILGQKHWESGV